MPKVHANGIEIFYEETGTGEPLLLIAGFACDHTNWSRMIPFLAPRYRVIAFDNRGVGQTSVPNTPYSIAQMAQDAAGLLDVLGLNQVHVAGHSMGGQIAQELTLARPQQVRTLTLLATCVKMDERGKAVIESWGDLPGLVDGATGLRLSFPWIYTSHFYAVEGAVERDDAGAAGRLARVLDRRLDGLGAGVAEERVRAAEAFGQQFREAKHRLRPVEVRNVP